MPQNYCIATGNKILFVRKYHFRRVHPQIILFKLHSDLRQFASKFNKPRALHHGHRPHHKKVLPLPPFLFLPLPLDSHRPRTALNRPGNEQRALLGQEQTITCCRAHSPHVSRSHGAQSQAMRKGGRRRRFKVQTGKNGP